MLSRGRRASPYRCLSCHRLPSSLPFRRVTPRRRSRVVFLFSLAAAGDVNARVGGARVASRARATNACSFLWLVSRVARGALGGVAGPRGTCAMDATARKSPSLFSQFLVHSRSSKEVRATALSCLSASDEGVDAASCVWFSSINFEVDDLVDVHARQQHTLPTSGSNIRNLSSLQHQIQADPSAAALPAIAKTHLYPARALRRELAQNYPTTYSGSVSPPEERSTNSPRA